MSEEANYILFLDVEGKYVAGNFLVGCMRVCVSVFFKHSSWSVCSDVALQGAIAAG